MSVLCIDTLRKYTSVSAVYRWVFCEKPWNTLKLINTAKNSE